MKDLRRKRGNDFQDWTETWLTARGWSCHNQKTVSKAIPIKGKIIWTSARNDILAMDIVAVRPGHKTLFIQTTLDSGVQKRVDEAKEIGWELTHQEVLLFQKRGVGDITVQKWGGAGFYEVGKILRGKLFLSGEADL